MSIETETAAAVQTVRASGDYPDPADPDGEPLFYLTVGKAIEEARRVFDRLRSALGPAWVVTSELDAKRLADEEVEVSAWLCRGEVEAVVRVWQGSERDVQLRLFFDEAMPVELDGGGDR